MGAVNACWVVDDRSDVYQTGDDEGVAPFIEHDRVFDDGGHESHVLFLLVLRYL